MQSLFHNYLSLSQPPIPAPSHPIPSILNPVYLENFQLSLCAFMDYSLETDHILVVQGSCPMMILGRSQRIVKVIHVSSLSLSTQHLINYSPRASLVVQCLGLRASTARGAGLIPGRGTKIPHARSQKK